MSTFDSLSDMDLRNKLLEHGYDLPVSLNRRFLIKKLEKIVEEKKSKEKAGGKVSVSPLSPLKRRRANDEDDLSSPSINAPPAPVVNRRSGRKSTPAPRPPTITFTPTNSNSSTPSTTRGSRASIRPTRNATVLHQRDTKPVQEVKVQMVQPQLPGNMFAIIVSGRLIQSNFVQSLEEPKKFAIDIPEASGINYIVVALTGATPFPPGTGGQIYFGWIDPQDQAIRWHLLGYIANDKPSAIFKVADLKKALELFQSQTGGKLFSSNSAQIGISIEPIGLVLQTAPPFDTELL